MKKFIGLLLLTIVLVALVPFREGLLGMLAWFGSLEAITSSMEHAGIWGPIVLFILLFCRSSWPLSRDKP